MCETIATFKSTYHNFFGDYPSRITPGATTSKIIGEINRRCLQLRVHIALYFKTLFKWMSRMHKDPRKYSLGFYKGDIALRIYQQECREHSDYIDPVTALKNEVTNAKQYLQSLQPPLTKRDVINTISPYYLALDPDLHCGPTKVMCALSPAKLADVFKATRYLNQHPALLTTLQECMT